MDGKVKEQSDEWHRKYLERDKQAIEENVWRKQAEARLEKAEARVFEAHNILLKHFGGNPKLPRVLNLLEQVIAREP